MHGAGADGGERCARRAALAALGDLLQGVLCINGPRLQLGHPSFVHFCLQYCYADLQNACDLLSSTTADDADLLDYIIVDPGALHSPNGTTRTGHSLSLTEGSPGVMYADLGAAFCEIAERRAEFRGQAVLVSSVGEVTETWGVLAGYLGQGAKGRVWG